MMKAVLFDLDGTLLDTSDGIKHSVRYTLNQMGHEELPDEVLLKFVGPPIQNSLMMYCAYNKEDAQEGANIFRDFYKSNALFEATLYEGVIGLLDNLKNRGIKIGVATYKREDYAIDLLRYFHIDTYCNIIHGADNDNKLTKADIVEKCIRELYEDKGKNVLVGDTEYDAIGAMNAGVDFIGVTYGFGFHTEADVNKYPNIGCANTAYDILKIIG